MFPCFVCNKSFDLPDSLVCHLKVQHRTPGISNFECKFGDCIHEFDKIGRFHKHLRSHKPSSGMTTSYKKLRLSVGPSNDSVSSSQSFSEDVDDTPCTKSEPVTVNKFLNFFNAINDAVISTVANLYVKDSETRSHVTEIVNEMKNLLTGSFDILQQHVLEALQTAGSPETADIQCMFDILKGMFDDVDTEWKRFKVFREHDVYIDPKEYPVGTAIMPKNVRGTIVMEPVVLKGAFIPPSKVLKSFLELPGVLPEILLYMNNLEKEKEILENFVQGTLWTDIVKPKFGDKLVLPLNMSFDDVETNKDLGSHTVVHKLSACHVTIASLPPEFQSVLENIFLCLLFHSTDKGFGLEEVFRPLLDDLKVLEDKGIEVVLNNEVKRVYFALCIISGDNLGINTILGMVESFSANYYCRMCIVHKDVAAEDSVERPNLIRTQDAYERHVQRQDPTSTGIKSKCIWDELISYKFTENHYADIMHDIIEGVGVYDMCFIIDYMVNQKEWLTLAELNDLVQNFNYGSQDFGNKPPLICASKLKENSMGCSASELLCLIRFFPLMVGHKVPDKDDKVWKFFLSLRELVDMLFAPTFARSSTPLLVNSITEHLESYKKLSGKRYKPKFHKTLHYGRTILAIGPLKPVCAMRSESKYKELRQAARATSSRVNICLTLAIKTSLKLCQRFLCQKGFTPRVEFSSFCERDKLSMFDDYVNFAHKVPASCSEFVNNVKWVKVNGTNYCPGMVVVESLGDIFPNFGVIDKVALTDSREVIFILKLLVTQGFDPHLHSYLVTDYDSWDSWNVVFLKDIVVHTPAHIRTFFDGAKYVMLRYAI